MEKRGIYTKKLGKRVAISAKPVKSGKYHLIVGESHKWTVVADGNTKATKVISSRPEVIAFALHVANRNKEEVIIHKRTGEIEERVVSEK